MFRYSRSSIILRNATNVLLDQEVNDCQQKSGSTSRDVRRRLGLFENVKPTTSTPKKGKKVTVFFCKCVWTV